MKEQKTTLLKLSKKKAILKYETIAREIEDGAVLITRKGQLGGAEQEDIEPMYPKNVGRSNETTPYQQALIMFNSKIGKLKDKGYKWINPEAEQGDWENWDLEDLRQWLYDYYGTDDNLNILPMRAQKDVTKIKVPGWLQKKFDGLRSPCKRHNGEWRFRSRYGKWFDNLGHLIDQLPDLPKGWEWDGELYCHGKSLQQIVSMIKTKSPENLKIEYRVYDLITETDEDWHFGGMPWVERLKNLRKYLDKAGPQIKIALTYRITKIEQVDALFERFKEQGYEGAMWRGDDWAYERGPARSWGLIKVKDFEEDEFEIVDVEEATGRDAGTAIFLLETEEGNVFKARPMGTRAVRKEYFDNFDEKYLYAMGTVRFQNYTDSGIPFHARLIVIRDYE